MSVSFCRVARGDGPPGRATAREGAGLGEAGVAAALAAGLLPVETAPGAGGGEPAAWLADPAEALALAGRGVPGWRITVRHVGTREEVLDAAVAYASDLATSCSPTSMAVMKQQLYGHALVDVETALAESNKLMRESLGRADFREGVASYVEKRPPAFDPLGD